MQNIWRFGLIFHVDHLFHLKGNTDFFSFYTILASWNCFYAFPSYKNTA